MKRFFQSTILLLVLAAGYAHNALAEGVKVLMQTSAGPITLELDRDKAPLSVANFIQYAKSGHYDGTIFHRVIKDFMIQGGGYDADMNKRPTNDPIRNEAKNGLKNKRGTIAMARTRAPHSATAQFFINHADNTFLDYPSRDGWGYAVFGRVVEGMDVVDRIANTPVTSHGMMQNVPETPVVIESVTVLNDAKQ